MRPINRLCLAASILVSLALLTIDVHVSRAETTQQMTPLLLAVNDPPVPFLGSDGLVHLVYELAMTNFSSGEVTVNAVSVRGDGAVLQTLDATAIATRLQPLGSRQSAATLAKSTQALLFLHIVLPAGAAVPRQLTHVVNAHYSAAPPGSQEFSITGGATAPDHRAVPRIGPPLAGDNYISGDSCCDAVRHTRAALPINGRVSLAQRYAVDWEQLDSDHRVYAGPREKLESYTIFGKPVFAVADATVAVAVKGLPEQIPGKFPETISVDQADGNAIVLDLGQHRYALYAHLQSASIHLRPGDKVKRGQIIALVGNSGNSVAPHLHFHMMDTELSLASNGLPYAIDRFAVTARSPGTEAFDQAEVNGTALALTSISPSQIVKNAMPLDQLIISFTQVAP